MCKPDHNQDTPQQCGLHHPGSVHVHGYPRLLLQHPHGRFLVHETPPKHVPPRDRTTVQPEGPSGRRRLRLHGNQEGNARTLTGRENSQRLSDQELVHKWICTSTVHTISLAPPHVRHNISLVADDFGIKYTPKDDANHLLKYP